MFHLSVKPISRSTGRTATAAAAYRSGSLIADERTGELHDYTRKRDVVKEARGIALPPGAPAWAEDRAALWNAAEAAEKRKDARVARDYEVAIPKELTLEQGIALVRDFAAGLAESYGVAVDYNVHSDDLRKWDGSEKGWQGYHAHVLTSTRKVGRDGFGDKAEIELSDTKRKSLGLSDGASEIERVRLMWEVVANRHLEQANQAQRIDRRSLKDQGIDREPTVHLGPDVTALERKGVTSRLGDINREAEAAGKERNARGRALRELGDEIAVLEQPAATKPVKPKLVRPSKAVDLSALDAFAKAEDARAGGPGQANREALARHLDKETAKAWAPDEIGRQDRERRERERQALEERKAAVAWAFEEIRRQMHERDLRVQKALKRAHERQVHREERLRAVNRSRPEPPKGLLAAFKEKAHRQAVVAWDDAVARATRLADKSWRFVERLNELVQPEQVKRWAHDIVRKAAPRAVAWYEQDQARERAERLAQEEATERAREQARRDAQRLEAERAARAEAAAQEQRKASRLAQLEQDADRVNAMINKANSARSAMTLDDKRLLLAGLTAAGILHDEGVRLLAGSEARAKLEIDRQRADRLVAAEMFRLMPRSEVLRSYPKLERHYELLDELNRAGQRSELSSFQQAQELKRSSQQMATAIESGLGMRVRAGQLEIDERLRAAPPTPASSPEQKDLDLEKARDRGRER